MKITLSAWGARNYSPAPSIRTLRMWVATGQILPVPEKVGRTLMVDERAVRVPVLPPACANESSMSSRALSILHAA
jgi:hypothetical protein